VAAGRGRSGRARGHHVSGAWRASAVQHTLPVPGLLSAGAPAPAAEAPAFARACCPCAPRRPRHYLFRTEATRTDAARLDEVDEFGNPHFTELQVAGWGGACVEGVSVSLAAARCGRVPRDNCRVHAPQRQRTRPGTR
jgi:hypothetical protein